MSNIPKAVKLPFPRVPFLFVVPSMLLTESTDSLQELAQALSPSSRLWFKPERISY